MEFLISPIVELLCTLLSAVSWARGNRSPAAREPRPAPRAYVKEGIVRTRDACVYCRNAGGSFVACRECRSPHHAECARLNGRCAVYGCRGRRFRAAA